MLKHPVQTELRVRTALTRIEEAIYDKKTPIEVAIWNVRGEPVPAEVGLKAKYSPFKVGQMWGSLWDTAWFRFRGTVPKDWKGREVLALVRLTNQGGRRFYRGGPYLSGRPTRAGNQRQPQRSRYRPPGEGRREVRVLCRSRRQQRPD